jgi:hypothetical protein
MPLAPKHTIASGRPFFANVGEVVDRLDQHTLASPLEQYYWLTGAKDGWGFRVTTPPRSLLSGDIRLRLNRGRYRLCGDSGTGRSERDLRVRQRVDGYPR